ncbi:MAG: response regulator transcription factor [Bacteroidales bacterium]|nr:response regulator transcription factor [Bacteroidales bacterium]
MSILIVDDHQLFRNGLKFILSDCEDFEVIAEASNGEEFIKLMKNLKPDIVLMDINMPVMNGIDASRKALAVNPDLKIVILSMYDDEQYYNSLIELGVKGFLLKDATSDELKTSILRIYNNHTYFSQELLIKIIKNKENSVNVNITAREKDVLELICKGLSNTEISEKLFISPRTVERHRANLLEKTSSSNSIKLVLFAIKNNLVQLEVEN